MDNIKMILYDGTEMQLKEFGLPMHAVLLCENKEEMLEKWKLLTSENLATLTIKQNDEPIFYYEKVKLTGVQSVVHGDDELTVHFYFEGTLVNYDREYAEAARILLGEEQ